MKLLHYQYSGKTGSYRLWSGHAVLWGTEQEKSGWKMIVGLLRNRSAPGTVFSGLAGASFQRCVSAFHVCFSASEAVHEFDDEAVEEYHAVDFEYASERG